MSEENPSEENPYERKCCFDCGHLYSAVSWWCGSEEATEYRGTKIPGCSKCPFWKPDLEMIDKKWQPKK
jgi:hypothetical protein